MQGLKASDLTQLASQHTGALSAALTELQQADEHSWALQKMVRLLFHASPSRGVRLAVVRLGMFAALPSVAYTSTTSRCNAAIGLAPPQWDLGYCR